MKEIFITKELQDAICKQAHQRTMDSLKKYNERLYTILKQGLENIEPGGEYLIKTIDRRIGKTDALVRLSCETGIPIAVRDGASEKLLQDHAKRYYGKTVNCINISAKRRNCDGAEWLRRGCVLKDEKTAPDRIREHLRWNVFVAGIESFYDDCD